jgi:hypothetical protein
MALATYPAVSAGGGIKAVQRGLAASAGTITITAVDTAKAFVNVFGTTSSGSAAISGNINAANGSTSGYSGQRAATTATGWSSPNNGVLIFDGGQSITATVTVAAANYNANGQNIGLNATNMSAGTTNLVTAVTQGYLSNSTSLVVSGACRWEVVEFA